MSRCHLRALSALLLAALGMSLSCGCDAPPEDATPTLTPTPAPTPVDRTFEVVAMTLGSSQVGVDLDGDGGIDNGLEEALHDLNLHLQPVCDVPPCPTNELLAELLTLETLNQMLEPAGQYQLHFADSEAGTGVDCIWSNRLEAEVAYQELGRQSGALDSRGYGTFGPADLPLEMWLRLPDLTLPEARREPTGGWLTTILLHQSRTAVQHLESPLLQLGGVLSSEALLELIEPMLTVLGKVPGVELDAEAMMADLEAHISDYADFDLLPQGAPDGQPDSFTVGFEVSLSTPAPGM